MARKTTKKPKKNKHFTKVGADSLLREIYSAIKRGYVDVTVSRYARNAQVENKAQEDLVMELFVYQYLKVFHSDQLNLAKTVLKLWTDRQKLNLQMRMDEFHRTMTWTKFKITIGVYTDGWVRAHWTTRDSRAVRTLPDY